MSLNNVFSTHNIVDAPTTAGTSDEIIVIKGSRNTFKKSTKKIFVQN